MGNPIPLAISIARSSADDVLSKVRNAYIRAYHGSPYNFDRFDASKIGTGEGAQAYGYGLYFAGAEQVSDIYRKALSGPYSQQLASDEDIPKFFAPGNVIPGYGGKDKVLEFIPGPESEPWRWQVRVVRVGPDGMPVPHERPRVHSTHPLMRDADVFFGREPRPPGHSYEVEIGYPEESLLDWDKTIRSQPEGVQNALESLGVNTEPFSGKFLGYSVGGVQPTGRHAYLDISSLARREMPSLARGVGQDRAEASRRLLEAGIPGIKYLDGNSRRAGAGTRN